MIRSCVKFCTMNVGCAMSDHLGRKPIVLFFILPNIAMDIMLIFADIQPATVFTVGGLWGLTAITIPTLRAWVCDVCASNPVEMVNAQGAFRGYTIGPATCLGIPIGTAMALWSNPKYAFVFSLAANIAALFITFWTGLDDTIGVMRERQKREASKCPPGSVSVDSAGVQLVMPPSSPPLARIDNNHHDTSFNALHDYKGGDEAPTEQASTTAKSPTHESGPWASPVSSSAERSWPAEGMWTFSVQHAPWSGFGVILELHKSNPAVTYLWAVYFLTFCANEVSALLRHTHVTPHSVYSPFTRILCL